MAATPPSDLAPRAARNSLFALLAFLYPTLLTIVLTPFVVHRLGNERYGIFSLATILIGVLGLLDFGMSPAIVKFVSSAAAGPNSAKETSRIVGTSLIFYGLVGFGGAVIAGLLGAFLLVDLFHISMDVQDAAVFAFVVAACGFLFTMLMAPFGAIPQALQRFDLGAGVRLILSTVTATITVVTLVAGYGVRGVVAAVALEPVLGLALYWLVSRRLIPGLRPRPRWDRNLMIRLTSFSSYAFLASVSGTVLLQLDRVVLGAVSGAAAVTFYVIPGNLASRLHGAVTSLTTVVLPATSDLFARGDVARVRILYRRATRFTTVFLLSFAIPAICFANPILHYWLGAEYADESTLVLQLLVGTYLALGLMAVPYFLLLGADRPRAVAAFNVSAAALNVVLISILIPMYEIKGAAIAYLATMVVVPPFLWYVERRVLQLPSSVWPGIVARLLVPAAVQLAAGILLSRSATSLGLTILLIAVTVPIFPLTWLGFGFADREDRLLVAGLLRRRTSPSSV